MKRRVIAIAVVVAAVLALSSATNWEPVWRAVLAKRVLDSSHPDVITLQWVPRWSSIDEDTWHVEYGPYWELEPGLRIICIELTEEGDVTTQWSLVGEIEEQVRILRGRASEEVRTSPPWWPHPPLIDLSEFEE